MLNSPLRYVDPTGHWGIDPPMTYGIPHEWVNTLPKVDKFYADFNHVALHQGLPVAAAIGSGLLTGGLTTEAMVAMGATRGSLAVVAASSATASASADLAAQATQIALGDRQSINLKQTAVMTGVGAGLGVGVNTVSRVVAAVRAKPGAPPPPAPTVSAASATVPTLGQTALKGVSDDMLVHFTSAQNIPSIQQVGLQHSGGAGIHFFRVGDVKNLTPAQVRSAIGGLAGSSKDVSAAALVSPRSVNVSGFQKAFQKEFVTQQQNVKPLEIRPVPGGAE